MIKADEILKIIQSEIASWHEKNESLTIDQYVLTDSMKEIRPLNNHRNDIACVISELAHTNTMIWHTADKFRDDDDKLVVLACRLTNPLNQHRNDLMEEIDEIVLESIQKEVF